MHWRKTSVVGFCVGVLVIGGVLTQVFGQADDAAPVELRLAANLAKPALARSSMRGYFAVNTSFGRVHIPKSAVLAVMEVDELQAEGKPQKDTVTDIWIKFDPLNPGGGPTSISLKGSEMKPEVIRELLSQTE